MKAYVIAIKDCEPSQKAAERCIKSAAVFSSIQVDPFHAVTPRDKPEAFLKSEGIPLAGFKGPYSRWDNVLSCFSSHYKLWKMCAEGKQDFLIFEHDAVVNNEIKDVNFQGILSYGHPSYGEYKIPPYIGVNKLVSKEYLPGAHAYRIKPYAARVLIQEAKILAGPTDLFISNRRFPFIEEYYPWPVSALDTFTTVQKEKGCLSKHSYRKNPDSYDILKI